MNFAGSGDLGNLFRTQEPSSMHDIDRLCQRQQQLRISLGDKASSAVEANPEVFSDADEFRKIHAKGRFRGTIVTGVEVVVALPFIATKIGLNHGSLVMRRYPFAFFPAVAGLWCFNYNVFAYAFGYDQERRNQYLYAKNIRMLRNI